MRTTAGWLLAAGLLVGVGCSTVERPGTVLLTPSVLSASASARGLDAARAVVITDNDHAFESKIDLVRGARESLDLAYFIFADDYSSSLLARELVTAARRGVRVRLLLDYHSNYERLDLFSALERLGGEGSGGGLEVRFYGRPTRNVVRDAAFLTLGCGEEGSARGTEGCGEAKFAEVDRLFAGETIDGERVGERNVSNLDTGGSGLFLSGLYGKNPGLLRFAVAEGQDLDPAKLRGAGEVDPAAREQLRRLGRTYFQARYGSGVDRLTARLRFFAASVLFADQIDPLHDAVTALLPLERQGDREEARQDWRYLTDYLHHKLLLADGERFQLGGRNVEDSYHMAPNALLDKYVFMDTDVLVELAGASAAMVEAFDRLWGFEAMVARLDEVRAHAPNDELVALEAASDACEAAAAQGEEAHRSCFEVALLEARAIPLKQREDEAWTRLVERAERFLTAYPAASTVERGPAFEIDPAAGIHYLENLPFATPGGPQQYGAENGREAESGKHVHALWLAALRDACRTATVVRPRQVILHNAYFFPPSNLLVEFARMVDGREPCPHVRVTVLTNSIETTDLSPVNLAARHALKAFAEYVEEHSTPVEAAKAASFRYFEYLPPAAGPDGEQPGERSAQLSLHSKVGVLGLDTIFIGSANADVRSFMMDSNNGLLIRGAPGLVATYSAWLEGLLADRGRTRDITDEIRSTPREQLLAEDVETLRALMIRYRADRWIDEEQARELEVKAAGILDEIYRLAGQSFRKGRAGRTAAESFNELFKTI
jgi:phosphatidylserine/phosphatidylglycerophosphate/cardiolipin synthase-like enzyme